MSAGKSCLAMSLSNPNRPTQPRLARRDRDNLRCAATALKVKTVAVFILSWKRRMGCFSRIIAFPKGDDMRMVRNFRMKAVRVTFLSLPR